MNGKMAFEYFAGILVTGNRVVTSRELPGMRLGTQRFGYSDLIGEGGGRAL